MPDLTGRPALGLTGATGFVGAHVLAEAVRAGWSVVAVARTPQPPRAHVRWVEADLTHPDALAGAFTGADSVLHCANRRDGDPHELDRVNVAGTANVVTEATRAGVGSLGMLSTTAVYEDGRHRNVPEGSLAEHPSSPASRSRLAGERCFVERGGFAVRPHLVVGPGDRWVVAGAVRALRTFGWRALSEARHSVIDVRDLAALLLALAHAPAPAGVFHGAAATTATTCSLLAPYAELLEGAAPEPEPTATEAARIAEEQGLQRLWSLAAVEHTYDGSRAAALASWTARLDVTRPDDAALGWYRRLIAGQEG